MPSVGCLTLLACRLISTFLSRNVRYSTFFAQPLNYAYTVIFCHGSGKTAEDMHLRLEVVDQEDGDYDTPEGWDRFAVELTTCENRRICPKSGGHTALYSV